MRTLSIINRETEEVGSVMDITGWSDREVQKLWSGLVYKVDFEQWMAVDSDDMGGTE